MIPAITMPLLVHAVVAGAGLLALWVYARLGARQPGSLGAVGLHLAAALVMLALTPAALGAFGGDAFSSAEIVGALFGLLLPVLTYVFLTALWMVRLLQRMLSPQ